MNAIPRPAELAQEVQRNLADEPVTAFEEPWTHRVLRWARKHKTLVSAATALLITAMIGFAVSTILVAGERNEAEAQGKQARTAVQMLTKVKDIGFDDQLDPLQKEFLTGAPEYYEQFTSRVPTTPRFAWNTARLPADGRYSAQARQAARLGTGLPQGRRDFGALAGYAGAGPEPNRALARTQTLLGDLLVRGGDKGRAAPLFTARPSTPSSLWLTLRKSKLRIAYGWVRL